MIYSQDDLLRAMEEAFRKGHQDGENGGPEDGIESDWKTYKKKVEERIKNAEVA